MTYNNLDDSSVQIPREMFEVRQRELSEISRKQTKPSPPQLKGGESLSSPMSSSPTRTVGESAVPEEDLKVIDDIELSQEKSLLTVKEEILMMSETTVNSIILKKTIRQHILHPEQGEREELEVGSIDDIDAMKNDKGNKIVEPQFISGKTL